MAPSRDAFSSALSYARRARDTELEASVTGGLNFALVFGPAPLDEARDALQKTLEWLSRGGMLGEQRGTLNLLAYVDAMRADFEQAHKHLAEATAIAEDLADSGGLVSTSYITGRVAALAGDMAAAERSLRWACENSERFGMQSLFAIYASPLADVLYSQGRYDEAERLIATCEHVSVEANAQAQIPWRGVRAKILARRRQHEEAEEVVRTALALANNTDLINIRADVLMDFAEVLNQAGRLPEAITPAKDALEFYASKGNIVSARRARAWLDQHHTSPAAV